jgi:hypothetical protein
MAVHSKAILSLDIVTAGSSLISSLAAAGDSRGEDRLAAEHALQERRYVCRR